MPNRTRIICTLGPSSDSLKIIRALADEGMDIARLNFSHGDHAYHARIIKHIRTINRGRRKKILIMQDLEGFRIRLGQIKNPRILREEETVHLSWGSTVLNNAIPLESDGALDGIKKGMSIFVADGVIHLKVIKRVKQGVQARVYQGGEISSKKNVNIPGLDLGESIFTSKDQVDLEFGIAHHVDMVAQSFVRNAKDVQQLSALLKPRLPKCQVIAKIECHEAVKNIASILKVCDGIIVARGDLGVAMPIYELPILQKTMLNRTNRLGKIDIIATQMLDSMITHSRPTRAEVSDVANAVFDGAEYLLLSGETAAGRFPVEAVRMMRHIIEFTERARKRVLNLRNN